MNLSISIVGLPNVGPKQNLPFPEVYALASKERLYGAALLGFVNQTILKGQSL